MTNVLEDELPEVTAVVTPAEVTPARLSRAAKTHQKRLAVWSLAAVEIFPSLLWRGGGHACITYVAVLTLDTSHTSGC